MVQLKFLGVFLVGVCIMHLMSLGMCCRRAGSSPPKEDYYCNTQRDLYPTNTTSLHLCQMACLLNIDCKVISYDSQSTICTRHMKPCLFPHTRVGVIYQSLASLDGKCHHLQVKHNELENSGQRWQLCNGVDD